jgi:HEPN domain-containing protein
MQPPEEQVRRRLVAQWTHKAEQDIRAARSLLAEKPPLLYPSCFRSQQAAEKYLKAFLVHHQVDFHKTHDIQEILDLIDPVGGFP